MTRRVERPGVRAGYDRWSATYDATPNPVVALDRRVTGAALDPAPGETVLDAGCGTGTHLAALGRRGLRPVGIDFSCGMLRIASWAAPRARLAQADLNFAFPMRSASFDLLLSSLVSEHLTDLRSFFSESFAARRPGGRLVFSAIHPELARAGVEANFESEGAEIRLGAQRYTVADYLEHIWDAGFRALRWRECRADAALVAAVPAAAKYLGRPLILLVEAMRSPA